MASRLIEVAKIAAIIAVLAGAFYYLAHYGLSLPRR
jgi:hypothetical protein